MHKELTVLALMGFMILVGLRSAQVNSMAPQFGVMLGAVSGAIVSCVYLIFELLRIKSEPEEKPAPKPAPPKKVEKPVEKPKPQPPKIDTSDIDNERAARIKELKAAAEDPECPLDPLTVGVQKKLIEEDYQQKLAERMKR